MADVKLVGETERNQRLAKLEADRNKLSPAQVEAGKMKKEDREAYAKKEEENAPLEPTLRDFRMAEPINPDLTTPREFHRDADRRPGDVTPQDRDAVAKKEGKPTEVEQANKERVEEAQEQLKVAQAVAQQAGQGVSGVARGIVGSKQNV